jgi:hypothetical protein
MGTVNLTQFVHPFGDRQETSVELPDEVCEIAKGQVLSCEMMPHDYSKVVFYSRKKEWEEEDEDCEIAVNGPGDNSPKNALERLIRRVNQMQDAPQDTKEAAQQPQTVICPHCAGSGVVPYKRNPNTGHLCRHCSGKGKLTAVR